MKLRRKLQYFDELSCIPHDAGVLWAGSDDGLIHLTRDGGKTWVNTTPKDLKRIINSIEVSPHNPELPM